LTVDRNNAHPFAATSTAALSVGEDGTEEEEGILHSIRTDALVEEFWAALSRTGVQVSSTFEAEL
jgi:hypothetical protein